MYVPTTPRDIDNYGSGRYTPDSERKVSHSRRGRTHKSSAVEMVDGRPYYNLHRLPGGLNDGMNQQSLTSRSRIQNKYAYLEDLTFINWTVLKPPPPPKVKKVKKVKVPKAPPAEESPEEKELREKKEIQVRVEAEKREAEKKVLEEKKVELTSKFNTYSGGAPTLQIKNVAEAARGMGYAPDLSDLLRFEAECGPGGADMDALMKFLAECGGHQDDPDDLMEFFESYDRAKDGKLSQAQVRNLMQTYGEPLTKEEFNMLLTESGQKDQNPMDYKEFVRFLVSP